MLAAMPTIALFYRLPLVVARTDMPDAFHLIGFLNSRCIAAQAPSQKGAQAAQ